MLPDGTYPGFSILHTLKVGPGDVPDVCEHQARFLVIAAPRPSGYQTWMNPGRTNRGALFWETPFVLRTTLGDNSLRPTALSRPLSSIRDIHSPASLQNPTLMLYA